MTAAARACVVVGLLSALAAASPARAAAGPPRPSPRQAPGFSERDIFGKDTVALRKLRGKVVVLNFWATWCGPCREEVQALEELHGAHGGRVVVVGASVYSSDRDTEAFFREHRINYPVFYG